MIERLLAAESALASDELDAAERQFNLVAEADPRNAIAVVGLARVAERRGDGFSARALALRALDIDPDEAAAARLLGDLDREILQPAAEPEAATEPAGQAVAAAPPAPPRSRRPRAAPWWRRWLDRLRGRS